MKFKLHFYSCRPSYGTDGWGSGASFAIEVYCDHEADATLVGERTAADVPSWRFNFAEKVED